MTQSEKIAVPDIQTDAEHRRSSEHLKSANCEKTQLLSKKREDKSQVETLSGEILETINDFRGRYPSSTPHQMMEALNNVRLLLIPKNRDKNHHLTSISLECILDALITEVGESEEPLKTALDFIGFLPAAQQQDLVCSFIREMRSLFRVTAAKEMCSRLSK